MPLDNKYWNRQKSIWTLCKAGKTMHNSEAGWQREPVEVQARTGEAITNKIGFDRKKHQTNTKWGNQQKRKPCKRPTYGLLQGFSLVRQTGLEPVRQRHTPLKRACLPIPALPHACYSLYIIPTTKSCVKHFLKKKVLIFLCLFFQRYYRADMISRPISAQPTSVQPLLMMSPVRYPCFRTVLTAASISSASWSRSKE